MMNTTFIPLFVGMFIGRNVFGKGGLGEDALTFSIINCLSSPLLKAINIGFFAKQIWYKLWPLNKF